ncbi:beta-lactamase family protein [Paenibacillus sp. N1-5-1-14]|uniref:serine hydrolase domain-containing protein n=1 Tax=Paenibacillus radicibacter TaxID=2972488 RepID=UPI0021596082|nr:serine hydrolase domain-containing protein [Paenibacillus radicibacter]MCR8643768.1 beta-lactamase family protein [Paenibacillus radicibacter]
MSRTDRAQTSIESYFRTKVHKDPRIHNAYLLVHSDKLDIHMKLAEGVTAGQKAHADQPYFIASVGKLFTSVLIGILVEKGLLAYEDLITQYLDADLLQGLHVYKDRDYINTIQIRHLLNHTSGLPCYFEDQPKQAKSILTLILDEPNRIWSQRELLDFSKAHLQARFEPGKGFHYSDTGYNLLGQIIEKITDRRHPEALRHYIFEPLGMNQSCLIDEEPIVQSKYPRAGVYIGDKNVVDYPSLGFDYAGGGIVSTSEELLLFMRALVHGELVSLGTIERMKADKARFFLGIDYGYGLMQFKAVPLFMPRKFEMWGNAGATGSFMFYHPALDTYIIGNLNQFRYHRHGLRIVFHTIGKLS